MARIVLTDASVTINSINLSAFITSVAISTSYDVVDITGMTSAGARIRTAGLADNSLTLEFDQDFAAASPEISINALAASLVGTTTTVVIKPTSAAVGASNPSYTFTALVAEWQPLSGAVGELSTISATWPISGAVTKAIV